MAESAAYDVVLLPTFVQVEGWRRARAREGSGLFGQTVSTFDAWVADLWERYGDGRAPVDSVKREMLMRIAFAQVAQDPQAVGGTDAGSSGTQAPSGTVSGDGLTLSPGLAGLAARAERQAAGVAEYDAAVREAADGGLPAGVAPREGALLRGIARYRMLLGQLGLVELGEACWLLAKNAHEVFPRPMRVLLEDAAPPDWRIERFFAACPQLELRVNLAPGADGIRRAPAGVEPRMAYPAGRYATAGLVADLLRDLQPGERAVVTAADPLALYRQLEPELSRRGVSCAAQGLVRFGETEAGRACLLALRVLRDPAAEADVLADAVASPFAGFTRAQANAIDARLRGDRLVDVAAQAAALREESAAFACLLDVAGDARWEAALEDLEALARELPGRSPAWRSEQLAALAGLRQVRQLADALGAGWRDCQVVLEQMAVSVPCRTLAGSADARPPVLVTAQAAAAQLPAASCAMVVACDLTVAAYPLAEREDAASTLFAKLGLQPAEGVLERSRRTFNKLMRVPTRAFACVRPLNDVDGNPAYASAMLEEFVDAYRAEQPGEGAVGGTAPDELPEPLARSAFGRGEELLYANARAAASAEVQPMAATLPAPQPGDMGPQPVRAALPPRRLPHGAGVLRRSPSPSQVEAYLECPYKWFVQNRLGLERLEEDFGAREKGTFAHAVLERFYRRFLADGFGKVAPGNLPAARRIMREEADRVADEMRAAAPGSGRLVPASRLEEHALAQLKDQLVDFLDYECRVLPGFRPQYLEYEFDAAHAQEYAGCPMVGTVDRIDVDDAGHAVIIDYKGSVGPEHDIADKDALHPGKVQARIYAQMVKRALGLDVVGALYLSYGKRHALAGAVDSRVVESAHVPGARKDALWCALGPAETADGAPEQAVPFAAYPFAEMLDATERLVADAVSRMERGEVAPCPSTPEACRYCPVAQCPKKGA